MAFPTQYVQRLFVILPLTAAIFYGSYQVDVYFKDQETYFRDKSALYGRDLKEGEAPSW